MTVLARKFQPHHILGIDIDPGLVAKANKTLKLLCASTPAPENSVIGGPITGSAVHIEGIANSEQPQQVKSPTCAIAEKTSNPEETQNEGIQLKSVDPPTSPTEPAKTSAESITRAPVSCLVEHGPPPLSATVSSEPPPFPYNIAFKIEDIMAMDDSVKYDVILW